NLRFLPHVIHFSGHGSESGEVLFLNDQRKVEKVGVDEVARLLRVCSLDAARCAVMNFCYSGATAKETVRAPSTDIQCAVGVEDRIDADDALQLSAGFYGALGSGRTVARAFVEGVSRLPADQRHVPVLHLRNAADPSEPDTLNLDRALALLASRSP